MTFNALLATKSRDLISTRIGKMEERDLMAGDVTISIDYSAVNFKDALTISGRAEIIREFPLVAGIDLAILIRRTAHGARRTAHTLGVEGHRRVDQGRSQERQARRHRIVLIYPDRLSRRLYA